MERPTIADRHASCRGFTVRIGGQDLHRHPDKEDVCGLDADHVIVDRLAFEAAVRTLCGLREAW